MQETILIIYLVVSIALVGIILLQQGKGAEMGASFGAGGANTVFGAAGSGNALTKTTTILAILFFGIALTISYLNSAPKEAESSVFDKVPAAAKKDIDSQLPVDENKADSIESALPPVQDSATKTETATDKAEEGTQDAKTVENAPADKPKKDNGDQ